MNLSEAILKAYQKDWSYNNTFSIQIDLTGSRFSKMGIKLPDDLDVNVVSVSWGDFNTETLDFWTIDQYRHAHGADQEINLTLEFYDYSNLFLWRNFMKIYESQRLGYPDEWCMDVKVFKEPETEGFDKTHLVTFKHSLVKSVGSIDLNTESDAQVAKIKVMFRSSKFEL